MQALREPSESATLAPGRHTDAPEGSVWIGGGDASATSVASAKLHRTLKGTLRGVQSYWRTLPDEANPSVAVYCSQGEPDEEIAAVVDGLKGAAPRAAIVIFSESASLPLARAALRAGARGLLHAHMPPEQIARALAVAERGEVVLPRELLSDAWSEQRGPDLSGLTPRAWQILELVAEEGLSNAEIARRLWLSASTVKQHLRHAYKHLGVRSRQQAVAVVRRSGPSVMKQPVGQQEVVVS